ncbi:hypothetical protein RRG08_020939 [Elysia crispata]|uniref:Uncharacterized protein n=1 Tax=Elysia crispata TaxID=231223 RepID=A0AAE1ABH6_9GAST|nr:hypothetical protein RRG08_020939 [Elysia crispata]
MLSIGTLLFKGKEIQSENCGAQPLTEQHIVETCLTSASARERLGVRRASNMEHHATPSISLLQTHPRK